MPISVQDIALANSYQALEQNKFTVSKLDMVVRALLKMGALEICASCGGKGYTPPATAVPSCEACEGAGLVMTRPPAAPSASPE